MPVLALFKYRECCEKFSAAHYLLARGFSVLFSLVFLSVSIVAPQAQDAHLVVIDVQKHEQYGRIILDFSSRIELPEYQVSSENGVLTIELETPIRTILPDISGVLSEFVTVARVDPDARGVRVGLLADFRVNTIEAGEKLFIDILPSNWQGVLPGLPTEVITELTRRAKDAAIYAERRRKAETAANERPDVELRVGQHPTFTRVRITWSIDVDAEFAQEDAETDIRFEWPIPIDLFAIKSLMLPELLAVENTVDQDGTQIRFTALAGVTPRFYKESKRAFVIDIDRIGGQSEAVDLATLLPDSSAPVAQEPDEDDEPDESVNVTEGVISTQTLVQPFVETVGSTVRLVFPFESETSAAVFKRGDMLWMVFDTPAKIAQPTAGGGLDGLADGFDAVGVGGTSIVRMKLRDDRLASMGSEGKSWVLSLGDILLVAAEPLKLKRRQDDDGLFEVTSDIGAPAKVHQLRDPEVGDVLEVVTAYPPAKGMVRTLQYVDFTAMRSVHGLVIKPQHDEVNVAIIDNAAVITSPRGLIVSPQLALGGSDTNADPSQRDGFIDLLTLVEPDPQQFNARTDEFMNRISAVDPSERDQARLDLARHYLANELSYEAIGTLRLMSAELNQKEFRRQMHLTRAAADVGAGRPQDALDDLSGDEMSGSVDALIWRAIAHADAGNFAKSRADAIAAEAVISFYPAWVRRKFLMAATLASLETKDAGLASRFLSHIDTATMSLSELSLYQVYSGRLDEAEQRWDEALDTYGQVIAADIRSTRAEAIYRTIKLLQRMDRLDPLRASETLATEATVWRGDELEAKMLTLLAELFFRGGNYREAFETVEAAALAHPAEPAIANMLEQSKLVFADLYLNGQADSLEPVEALTLYYDFRQLTPPGARGDEMIRNLARRLIKVDLLTQAADLLEYQVAERLEGAAKAQIAADLAIIYVAARRPEKALRALSISRGSDLPPALERQRRILQARALVDAGREDLALDLLSSMDGRDADLLRVDAHWRGKRYREAGELLERLYSPVRGQDRMSQIARQSIVKAAVGFVLASDQIGLTRLRSKFSERLAQSPEWPVFNFVTGTVQSSSLEFKAVARDVANVDSLNGFLKSYREIYEPDGAIAPGVSDERGG